MTTLITPNAPRATSGSNGMAPPVGRGQPGAARSSALPAARVAFWGALLSATFALVFVVGAGVAGALYPGREWRGSEQWVATYAPGAVFLVVVPCVLLMLAFVGFAAGLHELAPPDRRVFSSIGLSLALLYAASLGVNYFAQLTLVRHSVLAGRGGAVALLAMEDPQSFFWDLEFLGYGLMCFATLAITPLFGGWTRCLLAVNGTIGALTLLIPVLELPLVVTIAGGVAWVVVFPAAMVLAAGHLPRGGSGPAARG